MSRRSLYTSNNTVESSSIYQAFTDLMSNAFMILCLFLLLVLFQSQKLNKNLQEANKRLQSASPIVIDESSGKFKFKSGSAELNSQLKSHISTKISPEIKDILKEREIDFIQVIGHTDGEGIHLKSNLDKTLEIVAQGNKSVTQLSPGSNADLGLMRALSVVQELQKSGLQKVEFRAYSAAQLYLPSGNLASVNRKPDETRRRIEIRFIPPGINTNLRSKT
jgi:outer membrane protein OmpA-like peptidoglycan-associated protein